MATAWDEYKIRPYNRPVHHVGTILVIALFPFCRRSRGEHWRFMPLNFIFQLRSLLQKKAAKVLLVLGIVALAAAFFLAGLHEYLSLASLKASREAFQTYHAAHPLAAAAAYMAAYVLLTALPLPGAAVMTLAGGALFGLWTGLLLVSFASSVGATLAFLAARFLLRDYVQNRFSERLAAVNQGIERDGALYLLTLRLVPVFPFFIINLVMGLTALRPAIFYLVSQIGMLPATFVYVNAGTQIGNLESFEDVLSPALLLSFVLLGIFPLLIKQIAVLCKKKISNEAKRANGGQKGYGGDAAETDGAS